MSAKNNTSPIAEQLIARLDKLGMLWMVEGPGSLTEQRLIQLAALAQKDGAFPAIAQRVNELAAERSKGNMVLDEPFTELRKMLEPQEEPAAAQEEAAEEDPEMLAGFVTEAQEHLSAIEEQILALERDPSQMAAVHSVFRAFHTIKGLAGFLGLKSVQSVAHEVETLLDHARNNRIQISVAIVDTVLESSEYLQAEVNRVNSLLAGNKPGGPKENSALLRSIANVTEQALNGETSAAEPQHETTPSAAIPVEQKEIEDAAVATDEISPATTQEMPEPAIESAIVSAAKIEEKKQPASGEVLPPAKTESASMAKAEAVSASIRIDTAKLDQLMDMVGEMVIAQSILSHNPQLANNRDARLAGDLAQLARITGEVQRRAMNIRMMPIGPLFQKNAKLVRDLSRRHGKQVDLQISGEGTELDKTIAEELSDPLLHMIRNALDHGIETPQERVAAGKPATASLRLSAEHESGRIVVSISDDGRGLNAQKIFRKAVERGLVTEDTQMSEADIYQLIFAPGFSTAEKITDISGRGVGMDVVRKHVETLRGHIQIESELGKGTTFYIHLPLTLAIIEGLVIVVGDHRYIIPVFSVREMLRPTPEMLVRVQGTEEMILMRGNLYPLVRLHRRFGITPRSEDLCQGLVVVCEGAGRQFCLHIDDLVGRQEVVIKSLGESFSDKSGLTGCAILGDGRIGLILDMTQIFKMPNHNSQEAA